MHEDPQVPNFVNTQFRREHDFRLEPGLVIAIEPMVNMEHKVQGSFGPLDPSHTRRPLQRALRTHRRDDRKRSLVLTALRRRMNSRNTICR